MYKRDNEQRQQWISSARREAERISKDIDFVVEKIKTKEYSLDMARSEFLWRVLDLENNYINCDEPEVAKIYTEVFEKAKAALKRVDDKIKEDGLDKV